MCMIVQALHQESKDMAKTICWAGKGLKGGEGDRDRKCEKGSAVESWEQGYAMYRIIYVVEGPLLGMRSLQQHRWGVMHYSISLEPDDTFIVDLFTKMFVVAVLFPPQHAPLNIGSHHMLICRALQQTPDIQCMHSGDFAAQST